MNPNTKIDLWLKDGSNLKGWILVSTDLKISGSSLDLHALERVDNAYVYTSGGNKIYRERVTGTIDILGAGLGGPLKLGLDQVDVMNAS
jgi:hypothetical protein